MPQRMSPPSLWDGLHVSFIFQRFFGLSAFRLHQNRLQASSLDTAYAACLLIAYTTCMLTSAYYICSSEKARTFFSDHGYLWIVIGIIDLIFTKISYCFVIIAAVLHRNKHMLFYQKLHSVDKRLQLRFKCDFQYPLQLWSRALIFLIVVAGAIVLTAIVSVKLYKRQFIPIVGVALFGFTFLFDQIVISLNTWIYASNVRMVGLRFRELRRVVKGPPQPPKKLQWQLAKLRIQTNAKWNEDINLIIELYKDLTEIILLLNGNCGAILLRIMHDFAVTTTQMYMVFWLLVDNFGERRWPIVGILVAFISHNSFKMVWSTTLAEWAMWEVCDTHDIDICKVFKKYFFAYRLKDVKGN